MCPFVLGDPTGTGKGGNSIWGKKFPDEFKEELKVSESESLAVKVDGIPIKF